MERRVARAIVRRGIQLLEERGWGTGQFFEDAEHRAYGSEIRSPEDLELVPIAERRNMCFVGALLTAAQEKGHIDLALKLAQNAPDFFGEVGLDLERQLGKYDPNTVQLEDNDWGQQDTLYTEVTDWNDSGDNNKKKVVGFLQFLLRKLEDKK